MDTPRTHNAVALWAWSSICSNRSSHQPFLIIISHFLHFFSACFADARVRVPSTTIQSVRIRREYSFSFRSVFFCPTFLHYMHALIFFPLVPPLRVVNAVCLVLSLFSPLSVIRLSPLCPLCPLLLPFVLRFPFHPFLYTIPI